MSYQYWAMECEALCFTVTRHTSTKTSVDWRPFSDNGNIIAFNTWAGDHLMARWKIIDSYRVAFEHPGDATLAYLYFK